MSRGERIRVGLLAALLLAVLSVGLSSIPGLATVSDASQWVLEIAAIDVSMTPITVDMPTLVDANGQALYGTELMVVPLLRDGPGPAIPFDDMPFHRFKVPTVLRAELVAFGIDAPELRHAMCRTLRVEYGYTSLVGWMLVTPQAPTAGGRFGFNQAVACPG